jgi:hypothetical protein
MPDLPKGQVRRRSGMKTIPLTQGKVALVDDDLFDELNQHKWFAHHRDKTYYAERHVTLPDGKKTICAMHNEIFRLRDEPITGTIDHRDRNGLNNQRDNLRDATKAQQTYNRGKSRRNKSGYIGVHWVKGDGNWRAAVRFGGKSHSVGRYDDPFSAAWVRDQFARQHYGEFASLNNLVDRRKGHDRRDPSNRCNTVFQRPALISSRWKLTGSGSLP